MTSPRPGRGVGTGGRGDVGEQVVQGAADEHVLVERDGPALGDDDLHLAADRREPLAELLGVADRRRQRHDLHRVGQADDHLFPHRAAEPVGEVVHLVHDDVAEVVEGARAGVDHVPQHLGRHDDDRGLGVDRAVTGQQADVRGAVPAGEVGVLLVRQGLDRRRVERLAALLQGQVDRELADDGLARTGRGGDQDARARLDVRARLALVVVEAEAVPVGERRQLRRRAPFPEPRVRLGGTDLFRAHTDRTYPGCEHRLPRAPCLGSVHHLASGTLPVPARGRPGRRTARGGRRWAGRPGWRRGPTPR